MKERKDYPLCSSYRLTVSEKLVMDEWDYRSVIEKNGLENGENCIIKSFMTV